MEYLVIGIIAFLTSIVSGMLGLGGAVLLIPAYLYIPSLFGVAGPDVKSISGITSLQVFASSVLGLFLHNKKGNVNQKLVVIVGTSITLSSFTGAYFSKFVSANLILIVFAFLAVIGSAFLIIRRGDYEEAGISLNFNPIVAALIGIFVGFFGGIAGAPGAFILSPLLMTVLKVPVRVTIGSTLGIVVLSALAASVGKLATNQVPLHLTLVAIIASLPGIYLGTLLSQLLKTGILKKVLATLIAIIGIEMWINILF